MDNQLAANSYALVIGVGNYPDLPTIANTVNDANDISILLTDPARGGLNRDHLRLLTNGDATAQKVDNGLTWLAKQTTADTTTFVFFSGHGLQRVGGRDIGSYLCPYDVDPANLPRTAFSRNDLITSFTAIKGKLVVLLDSCYSAGTADGSIVGGLSVADYQALAGRDRAVIASSDSNELSYIMPNQRNSLFTACLLEVFNGRGIPTDQQFISIYDISEYVIQQVSRRNPKQHPHTEIGGGAFPVGRNPLYQPSGSDQPIPPPPLEQPAQPPLITIPEGKPANHTASQIVNNITIGDISGVSGTVVIGDHNTVSTGSQPTNSSQTGVPPTTAPAFNLFNLNTALKRGITKGDLEQICVYLKGAVSYWQDIDYQNLDGNGPLDKCLSLIQDADRHRALAALIDGINEVRPELLTNNYSGWRAWAAAKDAK